jgi:signal transduction histidine kinase
MHLNPHTILPIICLILSLGSGFFVIKANPKARLNQIYLGICLSICGWFSFLLPFNFNFKEEILLNWFRLTYCAIPFIPVTCFTFVTTYLKKENNDHWYKINLIIGSFFSIICISTPWIIQGVIYYPWYPYPQAGILHKFLVFHCLYLVFFIIKFLTDSIKKGDIEPKQLNQRKYMLCAFISLSVATIDFISNYNIPIYQAGCIPTTIFLLIVAVAILKHQLMDIQIVIRKSLAYSILVSFITLIFLVMVLVTEKLSQTYMGCHQNILNSILLSIIIAIIFIPLRNKIQTIIDKIFLKASPMQIAAENEQLRQEVIQTEKFKAIATLASSLAHEIKNPLTILNTFNEYLPHKKNDPEFLVKYHSVASKEIERINNLAHELLSFAKPCPPKIELINPDDLISNLISLIESKCINSKIDITVVKDAPTISIQADPNQLKQALLNILLNAIDAMPDGGKLVITSEAKQSQFIISISDTGMGISEEDLKHIFDPFFTKKEKGTGLGLAITQGIIEKHRGKITVESKPDQGTTFRIEIS